MARVGFRSEPDMEGSLLHDLPYTVQPSQPDDSRTGDAGNHRLRRTGDSQPEARVAAIDPSADGDCDGKLSRRLTADCRRRYLDAIRTRAHRRIRRHKSSINLLEWDRHDHR